MRLGILADVHANLPALQAVMKDSQSRVDAWWFLGDAVGRGPYPVETIHLLREMVKPFSPNWQVGNHDLYVNQRLSNSQIRSIDREIHAIHREALRQYRPHGVQTPTLWAWCRRNWKLERARPQHISGARADYWLVHGALGDPNMHVGNTSAAYLFPWDVVHRDEKIRSQIRFLQRLRNANRPAILIHGHTHIPYIAMMPHGFDAPLLWPIRYNEPIELQYSQMVFINPGSVGQPRNGEPRSHAAYGILDLSADTFEFRQAFYDCHDVCQKMLEEGYDRSLVYILAGNFSDNPLNGQNAEWHFWQLVYKRQSWGWSPIPREVS